MELLPLCLFALLAGFVDAIAGGGGLIQLPALLAFLPAPLSIHIPAVYGTNKLSSVFGTSMAVTQYSRSVPIDWNITLAAAGLAFIGSWMGARTVVEIPAPYLKLFVLTLLIAVAAWTFLYKDRVLHKKAASGRKAGHRLWIAALAGLAIGFYDGFFGPGTGSFLIFVWVSWLGATFLEASASAKVVNLMTNIAAISYFASHGSIYWQYGLTMGACNLVGGWCGSKFAIAKGQLWIRYIFLAVVLALCTKLAFGK